MDKLDIAILRELLIDKGALALQADVRRPYSDIARILNVTDETVRTRVKKMHDTGLIQGWRLGLNPSLFDHQMEFVSADVNPPSSKEDVIRWARITPHVIAIQSFAGGSVGIALAYATRERLDGTIVELKRRTNSRSVFATKTPFPSCRIRLTDTDWRIIKAIGKDPRKPYWKAAMELGISRRTVKRRAERMINGHAFWLLPELDLRNLDGVFANLSVSYPKGLKSYIDGQILRRYGLSMVIGHSTLPEYSWFAFVVPNLGIANEIQLWTAGLEGVETAEVMTTEEIVYPLTEPFEMELQKMPLVLVEG